MVNDGRGAETVITPDGRAFIPKGRNVVLNAPKGTHVLTAEETAQLQGSKAPKYRYKKVLTSLVVCGTVLKMLLVM